MWKRGQAAGAAILLAIVVGLMIMFIVLIPPQERAEILGENISDVDNRTELDQRPSEKVLLRKSPGRIDYLAQLEIEHPLPTIKILTRTESTVLAEKNIAYLKKGVFSEENALFSFKLTDLEHTENVLLHFGVNSATGRIIITLNGEEVFNADVENGLREPIPLPKNQLQENNELVFRVASPGLAFWVTNEASLQDIKIVADVTNIDAQFSRHVFLISETEKSNMERVILKFQPDCEFADVGRLHITVNGDEIYSAVPDCDLSMVPIEFSPDKVDQGENQITFRTERGPYVLSHVVLESRLKEVDFPTYYFELSEEEFNDIDEERRRVRVTLEFVDVVTSKRGDIVFNGHVYSFDTKEVSETFDVSDDVVRGNNAIKIKPRRTLEVRELRAELVKS